MEDCKLLDRQYIANTYKRFDLEAVSGSGSVIVADDSRKYIDMGSGIAVNGLGICNPVWKKAVREQLSTLSHTSNLYYTRPQTELAKKLCVGSGMKKVFFCNSGAEANEAAIKAARKYSFDKYGAGRERIITLVNSFHGRTVTTLSATGQEVFHNYFFPFTEGFDYAPANDFEAMQSLVSDKTAAIMIELVQGEGGVIALDKEYVTQIAALCAQKDILLVIDEVQTGNGRTGTLWCWQQYGITPDIFTTAKGLGGGLPIGAAIFGAKTANTLGPGSHGSTFGGNPICCAGALAVLDSIDDALLQSVAKKSDYIKSRLLGRPGINSISGLGLMLGVATQKPAAEVAQACLQRGLLVLTAKDKVRLLPALNIPERILKRACDIILEVVK